MIKKMIILIVMGLIFSSCQLFTEAIKDNIYRYETEETLKEYKKKDGSMVYQGNREVFSVVKEVLKRPINKKVQFEGATFIIPEGTRINPKHGNIVDEKTGYGIAITFTLSSYCISKKVNNIKYSFFYNSKHNVNVAKIAKEIMRVNGFNDTCK